MQHPNLQRKIRDRANRLLLQIREELDTRVIDAALAAPQNKSLEQVAEEQLSLYNATQKPLLLVAIETAW